MEKDTTKAWPVIGFDAPAHRLEQVLQRCETQNIGVEDVTASEDVHFRVIGPTPTSSPRR